MTKALADFLKSSKEEGSRKGNKMQNWKEFLEENYELTEEEFAELATYEKRTIELEYEAMWKGYLW